MSLMAEIIEYRLRPEADAARFLDASAAVDAWARARPGFVSRNICRREDGGWLDLVVWADAQSLAAADAAFIEALGGSAYFEMIDPASLRMESAPLHGAVAMPA